MSAPPIRRATLGRACPGRHGQLDLDHHPTKETRLSVPIEHLAGATAIHPFRVEVPDQGLVELPRRLALARPAGH